MVCLSVHARQRSGEAEYRLCPPYARMVVVWLFGNALVSINEVTLRRARLVLEWVAGPGFNI